MITREITHLIVITLCGIIWFVATIFNEDTIQVAVWFGCLMIAIGIAFLIGAIEKLNKSKSSSVKPKNVK